MKKPWTGGRVTKKRNAGIGDILTLDSAATVTIHMKLEGFKNTTLKLIGSTGNSFKESD